MANEALCLQWNDFRENVSSAFGDLRQDKEFTDVTLACEDGQQVEGHKVVLIASSPFFLNILKRNKHSHPLIYMRGVMSENIIAMHYRLRRNLEIRNLPKCVPLPPFCWTGIISDKKYFIYFPHFWPVFRV